MKINKIQDIDRPKGIVVFITGVTGQDGSIMTDYLLRETDASIIGGARRLSVENHDNIKHLESEPRFQLVNFDLTDSHSMYKIIECAKPDYFINFAAQSFVASSWDFARQTWECNSTAVLDCLEAIKRFKPDCRFYNAGSSEEFGNASYEPQDEIHPLKPRSPYAASKASARTLVKVYRESYNLYATQGWLFNHEGPRRGEEFVTRKITKGVAKIFDAIVNDKPIVPIRLGNLDAKRDWFDTEDAVDAVWRMLNQDKFSTPSNPIRKWIDQQSCLPTPMWPDDIEFQEYLSRNIKDYVVGSGKNHTIREFVEKSFNLVGIKGEWSGKKEDEFFWYESGPKPLVSTERKLVMADPKFYRPAEVCALRANADSIRKELGWEPKISFDTMIEKMVTKDLTSYNSVV
jgi:GDPmannose 4,6-dehydratase